MGASGFLRPTSSKEEQLPDHSSLADPPARRGPQQRLVSYSSLDRKVSSCPTTATSWPLILLQYRS
eukprot:4410571-Pleurochrysis_carterae.AAC.1